jgi:phospholipid N-methyltransferase
MRYANFIYEFLKHPSEIGTFTQSSGFLARAIARQIDGSLNVIEFGAGMGAVTTEILKRLPVNGQLTCFEVNRRFCKHLLKIKDPRLKVINDDAVNCEKHVRNLDCIVSGLPITLFNKSKRERILAISRKSGRFIQLQYAPALKGDVENQFPDVEIKFIPLNFPPAFVYICVNPDRIKNKSDKLSKAFTSQSHNEA